MTTKQEQAFAALITPSLEGMGYDVIRVMLGGQGGNCRLQIMAELATGNPISVEDCAKISQTVSALLDVEDIIPESYMLEVSSPGIDRPLIRAKDFERFAGCDVKIETDTAIEGRKRFTGRLAGMDKEMVSLQSEDGSHSIPLAAIHKARLVMTNELLKKTQQQRT